MGEKPKTLAEEYQWRAEGGSDREDVTVVGPEHGNDTGDKKPADEPKEPKKPKKNIEGTPGPDGQLVMSELDEIRDESTKEDKAVA